MRKIVAASIAFSIAALFASSDASAQLNYSQGYGFGAGVGQSRGIGARFPFPGFASGGSATRRAGLPYFAQFPPVYYSGIVRRPYGISPFAAPAGIRPVELDVAPPRIHPVKIVNPHVRGKHIPKEKAASTEKAGKNQSAKLIVPKRITNPFFDNAVESQGITRHASYEEVEVN